MALRVHIPYQAYEKAPDDLRDLLHPGVEVQWGDKLEGLPNFQVLVAGRPSHQQMEASSELHSLIIPFAGIPAETRELLINDFPTLNVYNLHHNSTATAEMAMALLLAVAKNVIPADRALRAHDWRIRYQPNENLILSDRQVLVLGYGSIGHKVGRMCQALGMRVNALRQNAERAMEDKGVCIYPSTELDAVLPTADVVIITVPLTPRTNGMMSAARLARMPMNSVLVNVARGAVVEEQPLFEALKSRAIAGAGIDVWYCYPEDEASRQCTPPATLPFHELDNVVMSPHRAGGSRQNEQQRLQHLAHVLNALARGESTSNQVDIQAGY